MKAVGHDRPRLGEWVRLRTGARGEVLSVISGTDAIKTKTDVDVVVLDGRMRIIYGPEWPNWYYEATIFTEDEKIMVVLPDQVLAVEQPI